MPGVKREATVDGAASSSGRSATRVKTEQNDNNNGIMGNNDDTGNGNNNNNDDDETQDQKLASILERLDTLETKNKQLQAQVKTLEALVPSQLVEFKFCSCDTYKLRKNYWKGVLHVPMIQHPLTGNYTVPNGLTRARGTLEYKNYNESKIENFVATFGREKGQPIKAFNLGYSLVWYMDGNVSTALKPSELTCKKENDPVYYYDPPGKISLYPYATKHTAEFKSNDSAMLDDWEKNAGGILSVYAHGSFGFDPEYYKEETGDDPSNVVPEADYKIKLYTVLSAHKPNQISIPPVLEGTTPDWDALERLVKSRYPEKEYKWVKRVWSNMSTFSN